MIPVEVRHLEPQDWPDVERIYAEGIAGGNATFESVTPTWEQFDASKHSDLRLVAVDNGAVIGWSAASPISARDAYRGVVEHSVYVASDRQGQGVGGQLVGALIDVADRGGVWTIQSSIFPENGPSIRLHEALGFRIVGRRERIALMTIGPWAGQWRDTILIERRAAAGAANCA